MDMKRRDALKATNKIRRLRALGVSIRVIARECNRSTWFVQKAIRAKWSKRKIFRDKKTIPKSALTPNTKKKMRIIVEKQKVNSAAHLKRIIKCPQSLRTVQRFVKEEGMVLKKQRRIPRFTEEHVKKREAFAKRMLKKQNKPDYIFDDEKTFRCTGPKSTTSVLVLPGQQAPTISTAHEKLGVGIWASFGKDYKSDLSWVEKRLNGDEYCKMMKTNLLKGVSKTRRSKYCLISDNAPWHKKRSTVMGVETIVKTEYLPALSPDFNPIENVWGEMVKRLHKDGQQYRNQKELKEGIQTVWNGFTQAELNDRAASFEDRLLAGVETKGEMTHY